MDRRMFFCSAGGAGGATLLHATPGAAAPARAAGEPFLNLRDFGAAGDDQTDDGPALRRALDGLASAGGGRLIIPPGKFRIRTPVEKDFLSKASAIRIEGAGSAGQLIINVGKGAAALRIGNVDHLTFEGVSFVGMPKPRREVDADVAVVVGGGEVNTFRDCDFYGISADAVLLASQTNLLVSGCAFLGCNGTTGVIRNHQWRGVRVEDCRFIDYGGLNGEYRDIGGPTAAWLVCEDPAAYPMSGARDQNCVTVRNTVMDEGAEKGIFVNPAAGRVAWVRVDGLAGNVCKPEVCVGLHLRNVDYAVIENSFLGYANGPVVDAVRLEGVRSTRLERVLCSQSANRITADKDCGKLVLEDCQYRTLNSSAGRTIVDGVPEG